MASLTQGQRVGVVLPGKTLYATFYHYNGPWAICLVDGDGCAKRFPAPAVFPLDLGSRSQVEGEHASLERVEKAF